MAERRFYWIKLKTDFFNQEAIEFLMSQENGCEYIVLYQMLCLNTANNNGEMLSRIGEMIVPYDVQKIVRDTKFFDTDTVIVALELFKKLGLIYEQEDSTLRITGFEEMVGSECSSAERVRKHRALKNQTGALQGNKNALPGNKNVTQEIDIDKDIDIYIKENNIKEKSKSQNFEQQFEELWKIYPKKQGKAVAKQKCIKALKDGEDFEEIKKGLLAYVEYLKFKGTEEQYIKQGSTWFNQKCWNDDYSINDKPKVAENKVQKPIRKTQTEIYEHDYGNLDDLERQILSKHRF